MRNEIGDITTDPVATDKIIRTHQEQLHDHKFDNLKKWIDSLKTQPKPHRQSEQCYNSKEIKFIFNISLKISLVLIVSLKNSTKYLKKKIRPIYTIFSRKQKKEPFLTQHKASITLIAKLKTGKANTQTLQANIFHKLRGKVSHKMLLN